MTPGARLSAVIELLENIDKESLPPDVVIDSYFKQRRYAGSKDRRAVRDRVYAILRKRARLSWHLDNDEAFGRALVLADLAFSEGTEGFALFDGEGHHPSPLTDHEQDTLLPLAGKALEDPAMPEAVRLEYPAFLETRLRDGWGEATGELMSALNIEAPMTLRVNGLKGTRKDAIEALAAQNIVAEPTDLSPDGLVLSKRVKIHGLPPFKDGLIEPQDEGSQMLARLVGAEPGMIVVDLCAGGGGKTLALADAMQNEGTLLACDVSQKRLHRMAGRLERAGITCATLRKVRETNDGWLNNQKAAADRVLLDVPCSGTGAWRRDVTARWRFTEDMLKRLLLRQQAILETAAKLVKAGGQMIYGTCSVLKAENQDQVAKFLSAHPEFKRVQDDMTLAPHTHGTDGFYGAVLERKADG